jgi:hypothetical protein
MVTLLVVGLKEPRTPGVLNHTVATLTVRAMYLPYISVNLELSARGVRSIEIIPNLKINMVFVAQCIDLGNLNLPLQRIRLLLGTEPLPSS